MEDRRDIKAYWAILARWWWVFILGVVVTGLAAFFLTTAITPVYEANVKVLVQGGQAPGVPTVGDIQASERLARNYVDLFKTRPILEKITEELSLPFGPTTLSSKIGVRSARSIIVVTVRDPDPQLAADIADTTARIFIDDFQVRQFTQIAQFQSSLRTYGITEDPSLIAAQAATLGTLSIVESAIPASSPSSPNVRLNVLLAAFMGLMVAGLVVFALEYMDDIVRTAEDLRNIHGVKSVGSAVSGLSELGTITQQQVSDGAMPSILGGDDSPNALRESFKYVSLNLEFAALGLEQFRTLLITSALPGEGKTTISTNLAALMARAGKNVTLVDADLRRPTLHRVFGLDNSKGLTNVLAGVTTIDEVVLPTKIVGLTVTTSGSRPPDPTVLLQSSQMQQFVEELTRKSDIVIFDSPPILTAADAMALASFVDGVVLVVDTRRSRRPSLQKAAESLQQANKALLGAVLNKATRRQGDGYYYPYHYYYSYGDDSEQELGQGGPLGLFLRVFFRKGARSRDGNSEGSESFFRRLYPTRLLAGKRKKERRREKSRLTQDADAKDELP